MRWATASLSVNPAHFYGCPAGDSRLGNENPDARGLHLAVQFVNIAVHRFVLAGGVVIVGVMNRNQIVFDEFSVVR